MKRSSLLMIVATLAAGCVGSPPTVAPSPTATTGPTPSAPSASTPSPTPAATPAPALSPTAPPSADWPPVPEDDDELLPPIARLMLADGTVRAGVLGSFSYRESSADSPWISGGLEQLTAPAAEQLTVGLLPGNSFSAWQASYAAADDRTGEQILPLASGSGTNLERASVDAPPQGEWVVQVMLMFPDDDGDATYYWRVSVP